MKTLKIAVAAALVAGSAQVLAADATGNMTVNATLVSACSVSSPTLAFGTSIDPLLLATGTVDAQIDIDVTCSSTTPYTIKLGAGSSTGATETTRKMTHTDTTTLLSYALYNDSARANNWGTTAGSVTGTGTGSAVQHTVYGSILSGQSAAKLGSYSDTVSITVTY